MSKLNIAVFFGGHSPEYNVSLQSAAAVISNLNTEKYNIMPVGIAKDGSWYCYTGDVDRIKNDTWLDMKLCAPAAISPNSSASQLLIKRGTEVVAHPVDAAFPVLHGKNGEDGRIQGAIELAGIPLAGCGVLASALCMDKDRAHKLASLTGVDVPKSMVINANTSARAVMGFVEEAGYPLYVKPVRAGSSYGITRVEEKAQLTDALKLAFQYDNQIILEEGIEGFEVGCAVLGTHRLITGEIDEIELSGGFFNFAEKYSLATSAIHVPARVDEQKSREIKEKAERIYRALDCTGFARVDMFLTPSGKIIFNEVNTIPGFTEHSRYPNMMKAAGYSFPSILDEIIRQAVKS